MWGSEWGQPPAVGPLPRLSSSLLSSQDWTPRAAQAQQVRLFGALTASAPANAPPSGSHLLIQVAYPSIALNKDPKRNGAVELLNNNLFLFFFFSPQLSKEEGGRREVLSMGGATVLSQKPL